MLKSHYSCPLRTCRMTTSNACQPARSDAANASKSWLASQDISLRRIAYQSRRLCVPNAKSLPARSTLWDFAQSARSDKHCRKCPLSRHGLLELHTSAFVILSPMIDCLPYSSVKPHLELPKELLAQVFCRRKLK